MKRNDFRLEWMKVKTVSDFSPKIERCVGFAFIRHKRTMDIGLRAVHGIFYLIRSVSWYETPYCMANTLRCSHGQRSLHNVRSNVVQVLTVYTLDIRKNIHFESRIRPINAFSHPDCSYVPKFHWNRKRINVATFWKCANAAFSLSPTLRCEKSHPKFSVFQCKRWKFKSWVFQSVVIIVVQSNNRFKLEFNHYISYPIGWWTRKEARLVFIFRKNRNILKNVWTRLNSNESGWSERAIRNSWFSRYWRQ